MAVRETTGGKTLPAPRIYLVVQAASDAAGLAGALARLLPVADVAAVLLRLAPAPERAMIDLVKKIAPAIQTPGAALLIAERADLVARAGADGAHLSGIAALAAALPGLKPGRIAGAGGLRSRHDAMLAGEAGADYAMFGEPGADGARPPFEALLDRVAWWAELFEVPCVAYAGSLDEIPPLCAAGADFIALGDSVFGDPRGTEAALREAAARCRAAEATA